MVVAPAGTPLLMASAHEKNEEMICTTEVSTAVPMSRPVMIHDMLSTMGICGGGGVALAERVADGDMSGGSDPVTISDTVELAVSDALRVLVGVRLGDAP